MNTKFKHRKAALLVGMTLTTGILSGQGTIVDVNFDVKHSVGGISEFEREKFITMHGNLTSRDWDGNNFTDNLVGHFLDEYNAYFGRDTGGITWIANQVDEDPERPGQIDLGNLQARGALVRNEYASKTSLHPYAEKNLGLILAGQYYPFWPGSKTKPYDGETPWAFKDGFATGEYMGQYINAFHGNGGAPTPTIVEVMNEPMWHFVTQPSDFTSTPLEIAQFHNDVADGIRAVVNSDVLIGGYTTAFPDFEKQDFKRWEERWKLFMDEAGEKMDFWSIHLYDFPTFGGKAFYRKGSNMEATFDMMEHYSMLSLGVAKPFVISEYGSQRHDHFNEFWSPFKDWLFLKSVSAMMMTFMERPHLMLKTIPFIVEKAEWGRSPDTGVPHDTRLLRQRKEAAGETGEEWVFTDMILFFELWKNVQGTRVDSHPSDPDIQVDAFVDGNKAYVVLNNLDFEPVTVSLSTFGVENTTLEKVEIKHLHLVGNAPVVDVQELNEAPGSVEIDAEATMIHEYTFSSEIIIDQASDEVKYYAEEYYKPIESGKAEVFHINGVTTGDLGEAVLRLGIGRDHGSSLKPTVTVNATEVSVPSDWKGYDQGTRERFFGVIEIPVPYELLQSDNTVSVMFDDDGGHIGSVTMQVFEFSRTISRTTAPDQVTSVDDRSHDLPVIRVYPNPSNGSINIDLPQAGSVSKLSIYSVDGQTVFERSINSQDRQSIQVDSLSSGIYSILWNTRDKILKQKLVIR